MPLPEPMTDDGLRDPAAGSSLPETSWRRYLIRTGAISTAVAVAVIAVLSYSTYVPSTTHLVSDYFSSLAPFADFLVVWLLLVTLIALTNRVILTTGLVLVVAAVAAVANRTKLNLRAEPLYPSDSDFISEPGFLFSMVTPSTVVTAAIGIVLVLVALVALARRFEVRPPQLRPGAVPRWRRLTVLGTRVGVLAVSAGLLVSTTSFNSPGNPWRSLYEVGSSGWKYWDQQENYASHGFVGGFLYNMPTEAMEAPEGYSRELVDQVSAKYEARAAEINADRTGSLEDTNIVIVLSESFSDPTTLNGFSLEEDPIPRTRALLGRTTSGTMLAQRYGGGTANMEFEVLTGQSLGLFAPQVSSPYQMLVPHYAEYPSTVSWFANQGYEPIAIHPFSGGMYKRTSVYKTLGFSAFVDEPAMTEKERIGSPGFVSDRSAFGEVQAQIAAHSEPVLVNLVTMQNHVPFEGVYPNPVPVSGVEDGDADKIGNYARGLSYTDEALADFLRDLRASQEKTVVIFYGDHLPGIYEPEIWEQNEELQKYQTPFFIWSNQGTPTRSLPLTSPTYFLPLLYETLDVPVPPYFALLDDLRAQVSSLGQRRTVTADGDVVELAQLPAAASQVVADARLVQYDFSIGDRFGVERLWPGATDPR